MIEVNAKGSFKNTFAFLDKMTKPHIPPQLDALAKQGVAALESATPVDSGLTADSWGYEIVKRSRGSWTIYWTNSHIDDGVPIAVIIQLGHGTGTGGYVQGIDYINPALHKVFNDIADRAWKVVTSA